MCGGGGGIDEQESRQALSEQAAIQLRRYSSTFVPLENMYIDDAMNYGSDANYARAMGRGASQAGEAYERGIADSQRGLISRGYDPSSGGFQGNQGALYNAYARSRGGAMANAGSTVSDRQAQMLMGSVAMGQGLSNEVMRGLTDVAGSESERILDQAYSDFGRDSALQQTIGGIAGYGTGVAMNNRRRSGERNV